MQTTVAFFMKKVDRWRGIRTIKCQCYVDFVARTVVYIVSLSFFCYSTYKTADSGGFNMENAYVLQLTDSKFKDLFLCFCGYAQCQPFHNFGPAVRPNYLLHFILSGKGIYQVGEKKYYLQEGQGFLIEPEAVTYYQADGKEPWTYLWVAFNGTKAPEYVNDLGLNSSHLTFHSEYGKELKRIVLQMLKTNGQETSNQYHLQSLLYEFFSVLARDSIVYADQENSKDNFYMNRAVSYIRNHYSEGIRVSDVAKYMCIDRSYLYKLFERSLQLSPQEFLCQFRISRAKELLTVSEQSIENVAFSCGYRDALVFSKAFKKQMGVTPTIYRKKHRKEVVNRLSCGQQNLDELMRQEQINESYHIEKQKC